MWWDWTEITLVDSVLFSLLSMLILYIVGFGILRLICALGKKVDPFSSFDFLQKTNFRIVFGFTFIFLFVLVFSVFNLSFLTSTLLIIAIAVIGFATTWRSFKLKLPKKPHFQNYAWIMVIIVFVVLLATILLSSMLITGFYGSTNDDGAYHTLIVRIILDHPNALLTRTAQPYAGFFLNYPSGTHVLCAFFVTLLSVPIQKIVMMISVILPALIALSFYSTIKCLFKSKVLSILGLITAAFFTISISWEPIGWGGLPLLLSLYLSVSSMGLIFVFLLKKKMTCLNASLLGLIFFIASETYPVAFLIVSLWFLLILCVKLLQKLRNIQRLKASVPSLFSRINTSMIIAFLIPILFSIPYFYALYTHSFSGAPFSQLNSGADISAEVMKSRIDFNWLIDFPALSRFFSGFGKLLGLAPYSLIPLIIFLIPRSAVARVSQRLASIFPSRDFAFSLFLIYFFMLMIMGYLTLTLYLPINFLTALIDPERVWAHLFIPAVIMTAVVLFSVVYFSYFGLKRLFHSGKTNVMKLSGLSRNRILACALLALLILTVGLLSIPIVNDQQVQYNEIGSSFNKYETLNQSDVLLMNWITQNIPLNAHILVSAGDSGQFVTTVTQRLTISQYSGLTNYTDLMTILTSNASDPNAVPFMIEYNVSYVYIGSTATTYNLENPDYRHFNATQFLSTPYFTLTKEFGNAWLFQFNASAVPPEVLEGLPHLNILNSTGGYTDPSAGNHYGSGVQAIYAYPNKGYQLDHWELNGSYLCGPENPVSLDYGNWNLQAVFTKNPSS
jgi:hypothetical protein